MMCKRKLAFKVMTAEGKENKDECDDDGSLRVDEANVPSLLQSLQQKRKVLSLVLELPSASPAATDSREPLALFFYPTDLDFFVFL